MDVLLYSLHFLLILLQLREGKVDNGHARVVIVVVLLHFEVVARDSTHEDKQDNFERVFHLSIEELLVSRRLYHVVLGTVVIRECLATQDFLP